MKSKFIWVLITLLVIPAATNVVLAADWPTYQGNFQRTGYTTDSLNETHLTKAWSIRHKASHRATASHPVIWRDTVYAVVAAGAVVADRELVSMNVNTGALYWSALLPGTSRSTPAVAEVDTTGLSDFATLIWVGGGNATVRCYRADGTLKWSTATTAAVVGSQPALVDTTTPKDGNADLVLVGEATFGNAQAFNAVTGALVWSNTLEPSAASFGIFNGPALSPDDSIAYFTTCDFGVSWAGKVHAVNSRTGVVLGSFVRTGSGFIGNATVLDNNTVMVPAGNNISTGFARRVYLLDRTCTTFRRSAYDNGFQRGGGAIYPDPVSGDTFFYAGSEEALAAIGWSLAAMRAAPANGTADGSELVAFVPVCAGPPGPTAISGSGVGILNTQFAGGFSALGPNEMNVFAADGGFLYWNKPFDFSNAVSLLNRSGVAIAKASDNDSGIVLVTMEGAGYIHGMKHSGPRARFELEPLVTAGDPCPEVFLNIPLAFNGTTSDTAKFMNVGDLAGSYTGFATDSVAAAASAKANISIEYLKAKPARERLTLALTDELTVTKKEMFLSKNQADVFEMVPTDGTDDLMNNSSYETKPDFGSAMAAAAPPSWLTVAALNSPPIAPGASAEFLVTANSAALGLGEYFARIRLAVTPDDADPSFDGSKTEVLYPIHLVVGYVPGSTFIDASDASLEINNQGGLGHSHAGFFWDGQNPANLYSSGVVIMDQNNAGVVHEAVYPADITTLQDDNLTQYSITTGSSYVTLANVCTTGYKMTMANCSLRVNQTSIGLWDGAFCDSVITNQYVITNLGPMACTLQVGAYGDFDVDGGLDNLGGGDAAHNQVHIYSDFTPTLLYGTMRVPTDNSGITGVIVDHFTSIYFAPGPGVPDFDSLQKWFDFPNGAVDAAYGNTAGPDDKGYSVNSSNVIIANGGTHFVSYVLFGWDELDVPLNQVVRKVWLRQLGYYRGDVNTDNRGMERTTNGALNGLAPNGGVKNLADVIYLVKRVFNPSTNMAAWPYDDQGDVNNSLGIPNLADVIALFNSTQLNGAPTTDYNRFGNPTYTRPSLFTAPNWQ